MRRNKKGWILGGIFVLGLFLTPLFAQITVIKAGNLIDPASGTVLTGQSILIEGAKIKEIGPGIEIPAGAVVIDLSRMSVLPGLFDCHTHVATNIKVTDDLSSRFMAYFLQVTTLDRALEGVGIAQSFLDVGFTTLRDVGNAGHYADAAIKRAFIRGLFPGPTLLITGKIIAPFGGQYQANYDHPEYPTVDYIYADTRDEMRKGIRENIHYGADWIKIVIDDQRYIYSVDDIRFIVAEAEQAGVKVCAHCVTEQGARNAVEAGIHSIEHGFVMSDALLKQTAEKGIWLVGTDFSKVVWEVFKQPHMYAKIVDRLQRAYRNGVRMAFGSDLIFDIPGYARGQAALTLIDTWLDAGIPAPDILKAFTSDAAEMLDMAEKRGALKPGMAADIIATPENPLENIKTLKKVGFVMKAGKVIRRP